MNVLKSAVRVPAGTNERRVREMMLDSDIKLAGPRFFSGSDVKISVDESLIHNGQQYLIEVDSGNMAKLLVGQYVLLNQLYPRSVASPIFLVIHTYKNHNPERTVRNLHFVNQQLFAGKGFEFAVIHFDQLNNWGGSFDNLLGQMHRPH